MSRFHACALALFFLSCAPPTRPGHPGEDVSAPPTPPGQPGEDGSWVGKKIILKKGGIKFGHTDEQGRPVEVGTLALMSYTVTGEEGDRIRVRQNGVEGWFQKGDAVLLDEAIPYLTGRIHSDPNDALAFARRGVVWMARGDLDSAIKDLSEAIRLAPDNADAHCNRGNAYQAKQEYDRAIHDYDDAVRLDPGFAWAYTNRGNAYAAKQEYDRAIHDYDEVTRLDPENGWPYNNMAWLWATCPKDEVRNGKKAVEYAREGPGACAPGPFPLGRGSPDIVPGPGTAEENRGGPPPDAEVAAAGHFFFSPTAKRVRVTPPFASAPGRARGALPWLAAAVRPRASSC
jgi:Tfp pilus assembly protein PilF